MLEGTAAAAELQKMKAKLEFQHDINSRIGQTMNLLGMSGDLDWVLIAGAMKNEPGKYLAQGYHFLTEKERALNIMITMYDTLTHLMKVVNMNPVQFAAYKKLAQGQQLEAAKKYAKTFDERITK